MSYEENEVEEVMAGAILRLITEVMLRKDLHD